MEYDGVLSIAVGNSAKTKRWDNRKFSWSEFVEQVSRTSFTRETLSEFLAMPKSEQSQIKDVGGYVGGYLVKGKRSPQSVGSRQLLTLDLDFANMDFWDDVTMQYGNAAVLHSTHKHSEKNPRFRLLIPLSRKVTAEEYQAVSRQLAYTLGIDLFDDTTFEVNRLMFWPSTPSDQSYYFKQQDGEWLDPDNILAEYEDWTDSSLWPVSSRRRERFDKTISKQSDPELKKGKVGAFCRTYDIHSAIETFLNEEYTFAFDGRYTYTGGSTAAGLITYDDKFAFSHHGTDPCSGVLCNAFDLVRIHKFGDLDEHFDVKSTRSESYKAMIDMVSRDDKVKATLASDNIDEALYDFEGSVSKEELKNANWIKELDLDKEGNYKSSAKNISLIMANDPILNGAFKQNDFDNKKYLFKSVPWRKDKISEPEVMRNVDFSGVRNYVESIYGVAGNTKIDDALAVEIEKYSFHPVREYLNSLEWDMVPRIDNLFIEYFGAEDNIYSKEAIRKTLVGAVARIYVPGCKFDLVPTLVGSQGTGKSTFIKKLGKSWFSDTFLTVHGKEALEQIQGAWVIEIAELAGLRKAEVESIKHFISKQEDSFRPAYARTSETYRRQCVFFGTTNNASFLRDPSGNRRFLPVDVRQLCITKSVFSEEFDNSIDQIWAEAVHLFRSGEKLYLSSKAEKIAKFEQTGHSEEDDRKGLISHYLDTKLPKNWDVLDLFERRDFLESGKIGDVSRNEVCVAEVWCECLGKPKEDMTRYNTRELNDLMQHMDGWERNKSTRKFPIYGTQKYFTRKEN